MSSGGLRSNGTIIAAVITALATIAAAIIVTNWGNGDKLPDPDPDYSNRVGLYKGTGQNKTVGLKDEVTLDLRKIEQDSGNVDAYVFMGPNDPSGGVSGDLSGTIAADATMNLSGDIQAGDVQAGTPEEYIVDADFDCRFTAPETIECTWKLAPGEGNPHGTQEGNLVVRKR